jgi:hypothetical protein
MIVADGTRRDISPYYRAVINAGLGERGRALDDLEKTVEERFKLLVFLKVETQFGSLRSEPRFVELVRRIRARAQAVGSDGR